MTSSGVIPTVSYFLVLLLPVSDAAEEPPWTENIAFNDTLVSHSVVLLGGDLDPPVASAGASYLLHTSTPQDSVGCARKDLLVRQGNFAPDVIEWRLVSIAFNAIHPAPMMLDLLANSSIAQTTRGPNNVY